MRSRKPKSILHARLSNTTCLFLQEEPCYEAPGGFNGPQNVCGTHTEIEIQFMDGSQLMRRLRAQCIMAVVYRKVQ